MFRLLDIDIFNNISLSSHLNLIPGAVSLLITSLSCTVVLLKVCESFLEFLYEESVCVCVCYTTEVAVTQWDMVKLLI